MKINTDLVKAKWVENPDDSEIQIKIIPFPMSQGQYIPGTDDSIMEFAWKRFNYSLLDWKGFEDSEGKPLECNEENKKFVYDYYDEIMLWVSNQITKLKSDLTLEKKT